MKKEIIKSYEGVPEQQVETGKYLGKVGYKYVYVINTWNGTTIEKWPIETFYKKYILKEWISSLEEDEIKIMY